MCSRQPLFRFDHVKLSIDVYSCWCIVEEMCFGIMLYVSRFSLLFAKIMK